MKWKDFQTKLINWLSESDSTDEELIDLINKCPHQAGRTELMSIAVKHINIKRRKQKIKQIQQKLIK